MAEQFQGTYPGTYDSPLPYMVRRYVDAAHDSVVWTDGAHLTIAEKGAYTLTLDGFGVVSGNLGGVALTATVTLAGGQPHGASCVAHASEPEFRPSWPLADDGTPAPSVCGLSIRVDGSDLPVAPGTNRLLEVFAFFPYAVQNAAG